MERRKYDVVVTFTFIESERLGEYFVDVLTDKYGDVRKIDQSTYGIANASVNMKDLSLLLSKAEQKGEKCKDGSELCLMTADETNRQIVSSSFTFQARLNQIK